jgi:hypothetical protein
LKVLVPGGRIEKLPEPWSLCVDGGSIIGALGNGIVPGIAESNIEPPGATGNVIDPPGII